MRRSTLRTPALLLVTIALVLGGCDVLGGGDGLTGRSWQWVASTTSDPASQSVVPAPESYTIGFMDDGTFAAKVDCNQVLGEYTSSGGGSLTITPGPSTLAACPPESLADPYLAGLVATTGYSIEAGQLILMMPDGTFTFE